MRTETTEPLRAHLTGRYGEGLDRVLRRAGITVLPLADGPQATVIAAGDTVTEAVDVCREACREPEHGLLVVADTLDAACVRQAIRAGVHAILPRSGATPARLRAALHSAGHGDRRIPYPVLVQLLTPANPPTRDLPPEGLTRRQALVLRMIADGQSNGAIARDLSCSAHTVKNVIYELMTRLRVNNRAHAVALGIRTGLI
ncbi:LuxR C-terminal-related transcriptional regulator [Micromonospora sp. NPDC049282]|uniref:helix-turn-helix transcriptional regulator n=1 Tax=Micromonospora sp. NPDC049282 TaxID=3364269 RepID=UPI00371E36F1